MPYSCKLVQSWDCTRWLALYNHFRVVAPYKPPTKPDVRGRKSYMYMYEHLDSSHGSSSLWPFFPIVPFLPLCKKIQVGVRGICCYTVLDQRREVPGRLGGENQPFAIGKWGLGTGGTWRNPRRGTVSCRRKTGSIWNETKKKLPKAMLSQKWWKFNMSNSLFEHSS